MKNHPADVLRIDDLSSIPGELRVRLAELSPLFLSNRFVENLLSNPELESLAGELEEYLQGHWIRGHHCTKEPSDGYFCAQGLRLLPHVYPHKGSGTKLCLWLPKAHEWSAQLRLDETYLPWAAEWLDYFEE